MYIFIYLSVSWSKRSGQPITGLPKNTWVWRCQEMVISQSQRSAMFNKVTAAFHKMVAPWPKMIAIPKWQPLVYIGEGPSGSDVLPAKLVVGLWSCQPITTDHVTGKGEWLPQQMAPEAAGRGRGLLLEAEDRVAVTSYLIYSWYLH